MYKELSEVRTLNFAKFELPANLWADILYNWAIAYKKRAHEREKILESLIPLYYGRTCSFVVAVEPMNIQQAEEVIEDQCIVFERSKHSLLTRWVE